MFVYIIYTPVFDKFYIGECEDFTIRLQQHNTGFFKDASTSFTKDWMLKLKMVVQNREQSRKIEAYIKSMKSKKYIQKLIAEEIFRNEMALIVKNKFNIDIEFEN